MGVFSRSFFKWVSHPFLCDMQITKWPFKSACFPRKLHLQMHICTCCAKFLLSDCWYWAGDAGKSLLSTFRLCTLQAGDKEVPKRLSGRGGISPSPAVSMCVAVNISGWPAGGGQALLFLLHRHLFIICPSEFLPLLEKRWSYHYFCLPCRRQALMSLSASHWGLRKSSEVGQKLEKTVVIYSCYLCLPHFYWE